MRRLKQKFIKNRAFELVEAHAEKFSNDFKKNKEAIAEFAETRSKKTKNKLAGYVTRLSKRVKRY